MYSKLFHPKADFPYKLKYVCQTLSKNAFYSQEQIQAQGIDLSNVFCWCLSVLGI